MTVDDSRLIHEIDEISNIFDRRWREMEGILSEQVFLNGQKVTGITFEKCELLEV